MEGRIRNIWENENNGQPYRVLNIDGKRYRVWNPEHINGLRGWDYVSYQFKEKGRYRNITEITRV